MTTEAPVRLLILDDEPLIVEELCDTLQRRGFGVFGATSTVRAAEIVRRDPELDVVLVDLRMPGQDGTRFLDWLFGQNPGSAHPEVVVMSGHADGPETLGGLRERVHAMVAKPLDLDRLLTATRTAAQRRRRADLAR